MQHAAIRSCSIRTAVRSRRVPRWISTVCARCSSSAARTVRPQPGFPIRFATTILPITKGRLHMTDIAAPNIPVRKIGHVGLYCRDLERMVDFYTRILGFHISDRNEKGAVFLRFGADHHSFVLVRMSAEEQARGIGAKVLQQIAMEVADLETLKRVRAYLVEQGVAVKGKIKHEGPGS